ncbi:MAG: cytochrome-c peroxidase [Bacteroidetes bacterium]|nr:MAG: cytochrome-c peroxidase [Bacteroidota bacterium]
MKTLAKSLFAISAAVIALAACQKDSTTTPGSEIGPLNLPESPYDYSSLNLPTHLSTNALLGPGQNAAADNDNMPASNPITNEGATLGRVLFYDKKLSANGTVACASCHKQDKAFGDDLVLSDGFDGGKTRRHSMTLVNARFYDRGRFFWDERAATLEEQVLMPFQDEVEMGMTLEQIVATVKAQSYYPSLFQDAFGNAEINSDRIAKALAQFVRSISSVNSRYDEGRKLVDNPGQDFPNFSTSENNGKRLFLLPPPQGGGGCIGCHSTKAFINPDNGPTNNGLDAASTTDLGVYEAIKNPVFIGSFKVPSLKSIALSAPYMHDGRFATLEEVIEHYNSGIQAHPNLGGALKDQNGNPIRLNWTAQQKTDVVNFLKTLTDETISTDVRFSSPFR